MAFDASDIQRLGRDAQAQIAAKIAVGEVKRRKYHNEPVKRGKLRFDSRKEAARFDELRVLLDTGRIRALKLQPQFTLQESYLTEDGKRIQAIRYVADFSYQRPTEPDAQGRVYWLDVVEDVKGGSATKTAQYKIKRKLFREKFGYDVTEI